MRAALWAAVVWTVALARLWRTWWALTFIATAYGVHAGHDLVRDAGTLTLAVLVLILAWKGPTWWREAKL